jgi:transcriptional regulator with XRE-family HTH domain
MTQAPDDLEADLATVELGDVIEAEMADPAFAGALADARTRRELIARLAGERQATGFTQSDVATSMGTTQSAVSDLEGGLTDPRLSTLQRYARAVGTQVNVTVGATVVFSTTLPDWITAPLAQGWSVSASVSTDPRTWNTLLTKTPVGMGPERSAEVIPFPGGKAA